MTVHVYICDGHRRSETSRCVYLELVVRLVSYAEMLEIYGFQGFDGFGGTIIGQRQN